MNSLKRCMNNIKQMQVKNQQMKIEECRKRQKDDERSLSRHTTAANRHPWTQNIRIEKLFSVCFVMYLYVCDFTCFITRFINSKVKHDKQKSTTSQIPHLDQRYATYTIIYPTLLHPVVLPSSSQSPKTAETLSDFSSSSPWQSILFGVFAAPLTETACFLFILFSFVFKVFDSLSFQRFLSKPKTVFILHGSLWPHWLSKNAEFWCRETLPSQERHMISYDVEKRSHLKNDIYDVEKRSHLKNDIWCRMI